jgi:hypothetical protein
VGHFHCYIPTSIKQHIQHINWITNYVYCPILSRDDHSSLQVYRLLSSTLHLRLEQQYLIVFIQFNILYTVFEIWTALCTVQFCYNNRLCDHIVLANLHSSNSINKPYTDSNNNINNIIKDVLESLHATFIWFAFSNKCSNNKCTAECLQNS